MAPKTMRRGPPCIATEDEVTRFSLSFFDDGIKSRDYIMANPIIKMFTIMQFALDTKLCSDERFL